MTSNDKRVILSGYLRWIACRVGISKNLLRVELVVRASMWIELRQFTEWQVDLCWENMRLIKKRKWKALYFWHSVFFISYAPKTSPRFACWFWSRKLGYFASVSIVLGICESKSDNVLISLAPSWQVLEQFLASMYGLSKLQ